MTYAPSSQAGLASFISTGPGAPVIRRQPRMIPCPTPGCGGRIYHDRTRRSLDGDPAWTERCTNCTHELEL